MNVLVVTPTFNERDNLPSLVAEVLARPVAVDLLIVDDSSPDGTGDIADQLANDSDRVHVMHRPAKSGLGSAYRDGFAWGLERGYDVLVEMDADLSHRPVDLDGLIAATESADLVIGSRYIPGGAIENWETSRRWLSKGGNRYVQLATGLPVSDATSGFRAFRADAVRAMDFTELESEGYSFQLEAALQAWRQGFVIDEFPITFVERRAGQSKISRAIVIEALWRVALWGLRGPRRAGRANPASVATA